MWEPLPVREPVSIVSVYIKTDGALLVGWFPFSDDKLPACRKYIQISV